GVLGRFAPLEVRAGSARQWNLRPYGAGLLDDGVVGWSFLVFVLTMLSTVTFDGFLETPLFQDILSWIYSNPRLGNFVYDISEFGISDTVLVKTTTLVAFPLIFLTAFLATSWLMVRFTDRWAVEWAASGGTRGTAAVAGSFVLTLVPIAVAYHLAHYF